MHLLYIAVEGRHENRQHFANSGHVQSCTYVIIFLNYMDSG